MLRIEIKKFFFCVSIISATVIFTSCSSHLETDATKSESVESSSEVQTVSSLKTEMRGAQKNMRELFYYIWSQNTLNATEIEKLKILVSDLSNNFHSVDALNNKKTNELGFQLILENQLLLLSQVKKDLSSGNVDFALWQLKGVTHNCFYCHTRLPAYQDLEEQGVVLDSTSFDSRIAEAEYLVATRQFGAANEKLLGIANDFSQVESGSYSVLKALKLWLLSNLRVKNDLQQVVTGLRDFLTQAQFVTAENRSIIEKWILSLESLRDMQNETSKKEVSKLSFSESVRKAKKLLQPLASFPTEQINDENLVNTIYATSLLHAVGITDSSTAKLSQSKKSAQELLYLLGTAYSRISIPSLQAQSDSYFKHCISLVPKTAVSKSCFKSYARSFELGHTGSSGLHYQKDELNELDTYRKQSGS